MSTPKTKILRTVVLLLALGVGLVVGLAFVVGAGLIVDRFPAPSPVAWAEDGKRVATLVERDGWLFGRSSSVVPPINSVRVYDAVSGENLLNSLLGFRRFDVLAFSPDGTLLAIASPSKLILIDSASGRTRSTFAIGDFHPLDLEFSRDGNLLAVCGMTSLYGDSGDEKPARRSRPIEVWNLASNARAISLDAPELEIWRHVAFSPNGERLVASGGAPGPMSGAERELVAVFDVRTGARIGSSEVDPGTTWVGFSKDGQRVVADSYDHQTAVLSADRVVALSNRVTDQDFVGPDRLAPATEYESNLRLTQVANGLEIFSVSVKEVRGLVTFSGDGSLIAIPGSAAIDVISGSDGHLVQRHVPKCRLWQSSGAVLSPSGRTLAYSCFGEEDGLRGVIEYLDLQSGDIRRLNAHAKVTKVITFSPDSTQLASAAEDAIRTWDLSTGQRIWSFLEGTSYAHFLAFSPDGRALATYVMHHGVWVWDLETGRRLEWNGAPSGHYCCGQFSPDSATLAIAGYFGKLELWNVRKMQLASTRTMKDSFPLGIRFSRDGRALVINEQYRDIVVWPTSEASPAPGPVANGLAKERWLSSDGSEALTLSRSRIVKVWDRVAGSVQATLPNIGFATDLAISASGSLLAARTEDGIEIWALDARSVALRIPIPR
ncbi:MAG: WD40 repeat domain-containing protein [Deltaproteobacteria bacterium]|nr:WD40 repeat domain-containing protein [Deltaproteobacteria bacterium]